MNNNDIKECKTQDEEHLTGDTALIDLVSHAGDDRLKYDNHGAEIADRTNHGGMKATEIALSTEKQR